MILLRVICVVALTLLDRSNRHLNWFQMYFFVPCLLRDSENEELGLSLFLL